MEKDYEKMFSILDNYLKDRVPDIDISILEAVEERMVKFLVSRNILKDLFMLN